MSVLISVKNLDFFFGEGESKKQVLYDVNLEIQKGQLIFLMGASGSGKTTLLTLLGFLRKVTHGQLTFLGHEINGASEVKLVEMRKKSGFIFQAHNLHDSLSAAENVSLGLSIKSDLSYPEIYKISCRILDQLGLSDHHDKLPDQLSGGEKQRVAIARALVGQPDLILADEPTAALDKNTTIKVMNILKEQCEILSTTILLVTHDNRIVDYADKVLYLEDGNITSK